MKKNKTGRGDRDARVRGGGLVSSWSIKKALPGW